MNGWMIGALLLWPCAAVGLVFAVMAWVKEIRRMIAEHRSARELVLCCPRCKRPFNHWFRWEGLRYCWPCGPLGDGGRVIDEEEGIMIPRGLSNQW